MPHGAGALGTADILVKPARGCPKENSQLEKQTQTLGEERLRDHSFTMWPKVDLVDRYRKPRTEFGREGWIMAGAEVGVELPCIAA